MVELGSKTTLNSTQSPSTKVRQSYNYALLHQSPGLPTHGYLAGVYQLDGDRPNQGNDPNQSLPITMNPRTNNDSIVTEGLLLRLTDCNSLEDIRVISLRNKELTSCLRMLSQCANLAIAYLQGNRIHL
jgi:hypothetical protein